MERFEAMPRPWGPRKAVGHSRFHIGAGGCGRRFCHVFRIFEVSSTFQHYTMQKANVLYIKTGQWGHIWRGLKQYCGLGGPGRPWDIAVFT